MTFHHSLSTTSLTFSSLLLTLSLFQGCTTHPTRSDFLESNVELQASPCDKSLLWWEKPGFCWYDYGKVMIDPVVLKCNPSQLTTQELATISSDIYRILEEHLYPEYPIVNNPSPGTLRIRSAITSINTSSPALNLVSTAALFIPLDMGGASIEVEFLDAVSGKRLAAMADTKQGTPLQFIQCFQPLGHTHQAFDQWAKALKHALSNNP